MRRILQLAILLLILSGPLHAQVTAGTSYVNAPGVATSGTVTMTTVDANSVVILSIVTDEDGTSSGFSTPTATGLTFVQIGSSIISSTFYRLGVWQAYTTSALGSTVISSNTWTESVGYVMGATDFEGTAGTAGNNGSDAIGTSNTATGSDTSTIKVTVNSTSHNNSKYFGAVGYNTGSGDALGSAGSGYTGLVATTYSSDNAVESLTEISTSPVSPPAGTAVTASVTTPGAGDAWGVFGIELLVPSAASSGAGFGGRAGFGGKAGIGD